MLDTLALSKILNNQFIHGFPDFANEATIIEIRIPTQLFNIFV